jgi:hypothetical protein
LINKLDIVLSQQVDYVARSALTQARKKLAVVLFAIYSISLLPMGINGLNIYSGVDLFCVDGVVWRTPETRKK